LRARVLEQGESAARLSGTLVKCKEAFNPNDRYMKSGNKEKRLGLVKPFCIFLKCLQRVAVTSANAAGANP